MASMKASLPIVSRALRRYASIQGSTSAIGQSSAIATPCRSMATLRALPRQGLSPCYSSSLRTANELQKSSISTTAPRSVIGWIQDKLADKAKTKKESKLIEHIDLMANSPRWTLKMFSNEIDETLSSWTAKMPGMSRTTEIKAAKETQKVVHAMVEHLGGDITADDLTKLERKDKLKLVIACKKPADEVNKVLDSFRQMNIMHRILRYRKENGIALPTDEEGLKMAMQQDGIKVLTKAEKAEMRETFGKMAMKQ